MKTTLTLCLALAALVPARAQIFRSEAVNGAVLGGIAGAVIGNNSGDLRHNAWKGAAIGAGAGLLLGEAVGNANAASRNAPVYAARGGDVGYVGAPAVRVGVGYSHGYYRGHGRGWGGRDYVSFGYYSPGYRYGYYPSYGYYDGYGAGYPYYDYGTYGTYGTYGGGSAAANGLLLGALAGGIIGNNSGDFRHNGLRGAAWGAGAGLLLGSVIDANRRPVVYQQAPVAAPAPAASAAAPAAPATPAPVTIINNYYNATPMSGANGLFGR